MRRTHLSRRWSPGFHLCRLLCRLRQLRVGAAAAPAGPAAAPARAATQQRAAPAVRRRPAAPARRFGRHRRCSVGTGGVGRHGRHGANRRHAAGERADTGGVVATGGRAGRRRWRAAPLAAGNRPAARKERRSAGIAPGRQRRHGRQPATGHLHGLEGRRAPTCRAPARTRSTVETNSDSGIKEGTIFRPTDLGGAEKYPIFVWGEGGCSLNGLSNSAAMAEIASHGYFVIADGTPEQQQLAVDELIGRRRRWASRCSRTSTWAIAENDKPCSAYYQSLDTTKVARQRLFVRRTDGRGHGAAIRASRPGASTAAGCSARIRLLQDGAHARADRSRRHQRHRLRERREGLHQHRRHRRSRSCCSARTSGTAAICSASHGGDFTKIDLAWLNWRLKGDQTATGKGVLVGASCTYCTDSAWEVKSMNIK